jgi:hypothetical protein
MRIDQVHYRFDLAVDKIASSDRPDIRPWTKDEYLNMAIIKWLKDRFKIDFNTNRGFETDSERISQLASLHIKSPELQPPLTPLNLGDGRYEIRLNDLGDNINGQYFRYLFLTDAYIKARKDDCFKYIGYTQWQMDDDTTVYSDSSWKWRRVLANFGRSTYAFQHLDNSDSSINGQEADFTANMFNGTNYENDELTSLYFNTLNVYGEQEFEIDSVYLSYIKYPNRVFYGGYDHIDGLSTAASDPIHMDLEEAHCNEIINIAANMAMEDMKDQFGSQIGQKRMVEDKT